MNIGYDKLLLELEFKLKKLDWMKSFLKKLDDINLKMNKVEELLIKLMVNGLEWVMP